MVQFIANYVSSSESTLIAFDFNSFYDCCCFISRPRPIEKVLIYLKYFLASRLLWYSLKGIKHVPETVLKVMSLVLEFTGISNIPWSMRSSGLKLRTCTPQREIPFYRNALLQHEVSCVNSFRFTGRAPHTPRLPAYSWPFTISSKT